MSFRKGICRIVVLSIFCATEPALGQTGAELRARRARLNGEIARLDRILAETADSRGTSTDRVAALNAQLGLRERKIKTLDMEIQLTEREMATNRRSIDDLRSKLEKLRKDYKAMVLFAFRNRNAYNKVMFIFASKDFNQAFRRMKHLQQLQTSRKRKAIELARIQKGIGRRLERLEMTRMEQARLLEELRVERARISNDRESASRVLGALFDQERKIREELSRKRREDERLAKAILAVIQREIEEQRRLAADQGKVEAERSDAEVLAAATPRGEKLSGDFAKNRGKLPWPVPGGIVTQRFGRNTVMRGVTTENEGIAIRTDGQVAVTAVFDGKVHAVWKLQGDMFVLIQHGKYFSVYHKLGSVLVRRGQSVQTGQVIGQSWPGLEDGISEIHFEVREATKPLDPEAWLIK